MLVREFPDFIELLRYTANFISDLFICLLFRVRDLSVNSQSQVFKFRINTHRSYACSDQLFCVFDAPQTFTLDVLNHRLEAIFSFWNKILLRSNLRFKLFHLLAQSFFEKRLKPNHFFSELSETNKLFEAVLQFLDAASNLLLGLILL